MKLVQWFEDGAVELYDLATDLGESNDLAAQQPEVAAELQERLARWLTEVDAKMPVRN